MSHRAHQLVVEVEARRQAVSESLAAKHRSRFGQFFTPAPVAAFLAELIDLPDRGELRLLDPGAGVGSLTAAVVRRAIVERPNLRLHVTAFELDPALGPHLEASLSACAAVAAQHGVRVTYDRREMDFIAWASASLAGSMFVAPEDFDACIMNPPYKKIANTGVERAQCERVGLRATNLYTAFLGLAAGLLREDGQLSAIVPRSFANGPYYEPFRRFFLQRMSLGRLHVYGDRGRVFADAHVLQENVVLHAVRAQRRAPVTLSTSQGGEDPATFRDVPYDEVVRPNDPHAFVRIPLDAEDSRIADVVHGLPAALADLDVTVSTGRVVDFRARDSLRADPEEGTVALIYPGHLRNGRVRWPQPGSKKPNALVHSNATESLLLPNEVYVLVRRFSAKEEPRRVVAAVCRPEDVPGDRIAFENHLNVYHRGGRGLPLLMARGLAGYLNSTLVDQYVRQFNGHTQINATDLRGLRYPGSAELMQLGIALGDALELELGQASLDALVEAHLTDAEPEPVAA